jgi:TolB-like protein
MKASLNKEITIAVLPFKILTEDESLSPVINGFTEDLIVNFSKFIGLSVISQYSTQHIRDISEKEVIKLLGADYLITGSFRAYSGGVRIGVQLVRFSDGKVVFAGNHDETIKSILESEDIITRQIVSVLQQQIDYDLLSYSYRKESVSLAAYENWLVGMNLLKKGSLESDLEARRYFEAALKINPHFARAYTGISLSYFNEWSCQLWNRWDISRKGAHEYALKAIEYDENDYVSLAVLGRTFLYLGEYHKAEHCLRKSLRMNPSDADNLILIAFCLVYLDYVEEAEALYLKAKELNPLHPDVYFPHASFIYFEKGDFKKSVELGEKVSDYSIWTDFSAFLAAAHYHLGDLEKMETCWRSYKEVYERNIEKGKQATDLKAVEWQMRVNPYKEKTRLEPFWDFMRKGDKMNKDPKPEKDPLAAPTFLKKNDMWEISFQEDTILLRDVKGFHDIRRLLAAPEQEIHCSELMGSALLDQTAPETFDHKARESYKKRIISLKSEISEAEEMGNSVELFTLREEYEKILDHVSGSLGLTGKARKLGSTVEKARTAVTWRIRSGISKIKQEHPILGKHLSISIKTGTFCSYKPETVIHWRV